MRERLLNMLQEYEPIDADDAQTRERFLAFVRSEPDCFKRSLEKGHLTGSAWLVDASGERVLLTHHRKLDIWVQLGGHADGDPDILGVALREAEEESGLSGLRPLGEKIFDLDIHEIPAREGVPEHFHYDVRFLLQAGREERFVVSKESYDLAWIPLSNLEEFSKERSVLRMKEKWTAELLRDLSRSSKQLSGSAENTAQER